MLRVLTCRLALAGLPLLRCRTAVAATLLSLLTLVGTPLALRGPSGVAPPIWLPGTPMDVALGAADRVYLTTGAANGLVALDSSGRQVVGGIALEGSYVGAVAVNSATEHVYAATTPFRVHVLAGATATALAPIVLDQLPVAIAVNPATGRVYVATHAADGHAADTLVVLDGVRETILATIPLGAGPLTVAVDPATDRVYVADGGSDTVAVLDGATDARLATLPVGRYPHALAVNARTDRVYVSNFVGDSVSVLDGARDRVLATIAVAGGPRAVGVNATTNRIYVATGKGAVAVLDGATNRLLATVPLGRQPTGLAVDAGANRVYVTDALDDTVWMIQDRRFGRPVARVIARAGRADALPPDGCAVPWAAASSQC